jgi:hypothetical protein
METIRAYLTYASLVSEFFNICLYSWQHLCMQKENAAETYAKSSMSHTRISAKNQTKPLSMTLLFLPSTINTHNCQLLLQNNFGKHQYYSKFKKKN